MNGERFSGMSSDQTLHEHLHRRPLRTIVMLFLRSCQQQQLLVLLAFGAKAA